MKKKKTEKTTFQYFFQFAKRYKISYLLTVFSRISTTVTGAIITPIFFKKFIDTITNFDGIDRVAVQEELFAIVVTIIALNFLSYVILDRIADFGIIHFQTNLLRDLEKFCFQRLQKHSYDFFANSFVGSLVNKIHRFYRAAERIDDLCQFKIYPKAVLFVSSIVILFHFAPVISMVLTLWMLIYFTGVFWATKKFKIPLDRRAAEVSSQTTAALADPITNNVAIKMFARETYENSRFSRATRKMYQARKKSWGMHPRINIFQSGMMFLLEAVVIWLMVKMWLSGQISVGTIVLIQTYLGQIYMNLWDFGSVVKDWNQSLADAEEMTEIINQPVEVSDPQKPQKAKIIRGEIEFQNVNFSYENDFVFRNFNLKIKAGEKVGLVGESGAGKSTITKLLLRFADIQGGKILIDGQDITKINQADLRGKISFVPQEAVLFHRSLLENIQYGSLKTNKRAVLAAAKKANAHNFIIKTAKRYQTLVGERGIKLSGGERQRIAIARAMLKNAPLLILDEATASLDSKSEKLIQSALERLMKKRTTLVIAHRLSTLRKMDRILVLDQGKIVENGSHKELLGQNGKYAELWNHQVGSFEN